jgi:regulator of protease activity HflC (stomatin/prohibitin superfamily)
MLFLISVLIIICLIFIKRVSKTGIPDGVRAIAIVVLVMVALSSCVTVVPAGNVGVVDFFGTVSDHTLKAGINFINPFSRVIKFSIKTQETKENLAVPSKEGLNIQLHVSCLYHLNPEKAAEVYKSVGKDYAEILLVPQFRSVCRGVTASYEAKALYTSEREMLSGLIKNDLDKIVEPRGIVIESVPMREIVLPAGLQAAIEEKLRAEQESQRMQFVLLKEKQEADRKKIEAQGISAFQDIISKGLSDQLLRWKGIEATEKLASSPNTKVIIVGGKDGLPLILDTK